MCFKVNMFIARIILLMSLAFPIAVFAEAYSITETPGWVTPVSIPQSNSSNHQKHSNGVEYFLLDQQIRVDKDRQTRYNHVASKALNTSGVEEISHISIEFDPVYETVQLHKIVIHRDGQTIDMFDRTRMNVIQREKDLEYQIYDGAKTINIFIEDVRSGDVVEYSYSREGSNPIYSGHFALYLAMQWSVPIEHVYYRVLWPSSNPLHIRNHFTDIKPVKTVGAKFTEYVWKRDNIAEKIRDEKTPTWYDPYQGVYLSDMENWKDVADWALPLYQTGNISSEQRAVIDRILLNSSTPEQKLLTALQFVQDEVRYLGIEMGDRSHKPNAPDVVLKQRFGDCKDKSLLLVSLLRAMDIEAFPTLVHTDWGQGIKEMLPTPNAFNHVIVQVQVNGETHWLDPTRTYQAGTLKTVYQPDYGYGLRIADSSVGLINMSADVTSVHSKVVDEIFDARDPSNKAVTYKIVTQYDGYFADDNRRYLSESNHEEVQQDYLNYLANTYPTIEVAKQLKVDDDKRLNKFTTTEEYRIPNMWEKTDDQRYVYMYFRPFLIVDSISDVAAPIRTMPYTVMHPARLQHTTRILVPENSNFENEYSIIEDKAFRFSRKVDFDNGYLVIDYIYESLDDHVTPVNIALYSENINKLQELAYYQIYMPNPAMDFGSYQFDLGDINWIMVIVTFVALVLFVVLITKYIYLHDPRHVASNDIDPTLNGLKGWLLIPSIGIILSPIILAIASNEFLYIYSMMQWSILEDQYEGTGLLLTIATEMIVNVGLFVMAIYLIIMFFQKRHTFPRFFIAYMIISLVVYVVDLLTIYLFFSNDISIEQADMKDLIQMVIYTFIWTTYFISSKRVQATFTQQRRRIPG